MKVLAQIKYYDKHGNQLIYRDNEPPFYYKQPYLINTIKKAETIMRNDAEDFIREDKLARDYKLVLFRLGRNGYQPVFDYEFCKTIRFAN